MPLIVLVFKAHGLRLAGIEAGLLELLEPLAQLFHDLFAVALIEPIVFQLDRDADIEDLMDGDAVEVEIVFFIANQLLGDGLDDRAAFGRVPLEGKVAGDKAVDVEGDEHLR